MNANHKEWTPQDDKYLEDHYETTDNSIMSAYLDRTENALKRRAFLLGLKKYVKPKKPAKPKPTIKLTEDERCRRYLFMRMMAKCKDVSDRLGNKTNVILNDLRDAFMLVEGRV